MGSLLKAAIGNQSHRPVDPLRSHEWNLGFHLSYQNRQGKTQKSAQQYFKTNFSIYLLLHKANGLPLWFLLACLFVFFFGLRLPRWCSGKESTCQCRRHEMQVLSLGQEDPLEKGMATHCSILAWRIPWTEEPGGLLSTGSQRVGRDWAHGRHGTSSHQSLACSTLDCIKSSKHRHW